MATAEWPVALAAAPVAAITGARLSCEQRSGRGGSIAKIPESAPSRSAVKTSAMARSSRQMSVWPSGGGDGGKHDPTPFVRRLAERREGQAAFGGEVGQGPHLAVRARR